MDAEAYLRSHGWRGLGYSLDHKDRGLKKPLLVSQKTNVLGVGKQKHQAQSDLWWLRAFDESLKQIGTGQKTTLDSVRQNGVDKGGLYGFFTKAQVLEGTIPQSSTASVQSSQDTSTSAEMPAMTFNNPETTSAAPAEPVTAAEILSKALNGGPLEVPKREARKRKKEHEPAKEVRRKKKLKAAEEARENAKKNRAQAIADGTFDYEADERKRKEREINKLVKANIENRLRAGEFGPVLPHPNAGKGGPQKRVLDETSGKMVSYKAEKYKREKNKRVAQAAEKERMTRLMYPELLPPSVEHGATQEEVDEWEREEKLTKKAKREAKAEKEEQRKLQLAADEEARKEAKAERRKQRLQQKEETAIGLAKMKGEKVERDFPMKEAIESRRAVHAQANAAEAEDTRTGDFVNGADFVSLTASVPDDGTLLPVTQKSRAQIIRENLSAAKPAELAFDAQADEIKLGMTKKGKTKKIPGVGPVDRYPTKAEKRQKKLESRAFEAGLTLDQYKAKLEQEKWEQEAPERERIEQVQASRGGLTARAYRKQIAQDRDAAANAIYLATGKFPQPGTYDPAEILKPSDLSQWVPSVVNDAEPKIEDVDLSEVSEKKRKQYAARAEAKGMSLEDYFAKRMGKKTKLANLAEEETAAFIVDTQGDSTLAKQPSMPISGGPDGLGFVVDTIGNADLTNASTGDKPALLWHPDMTAGRKVKDLSKEERRARLDYMRSRRAARNAAEGRNPLSKKERAKQRMERKMDARNRLVYEILQDKAKETGKNPTEKVSKEELVEARRAAKRQQRELKRIKRNKVIHRKNEKMSQRISSGKV